jgi:hypothetical protein
MVKLGDTFPSVATARDAIKLAVTDDGESYTTLKSDKKRYVIGCKDSSCKFSIRATLSTKELVAITVYEPHSCSPAIHYKSRTSQSIRYLCEHHRAAVVDNRKITAAQIRADERLRFNNVISYLQAYRTIQALRFEIDGDEANCFAKFPAYCQRYKAADPLNFCKMKVYETGQFEAIFFAPASCRQAYTKMRNFLAIDGTHTLSKYRMMLLICCGIDANDNVFPIAWGLVPIENEYWWTWFLENLALAYSSTSSEDHIFISDRDKGIAPAVAKVFPLGLQAHCCQHIADNIQSKFGNKCRLLFWACARAKYKVDFEKALKALYKQDEKAGKYIDNIPHKLWARYVL